MMKPGRILLVIALFCGVTYIFIYPVILNISSRIGGFYSTDESYGVIWSFWWLKFAHLNNIPAGSINMLAQPFGIKAISLPFFPLWASMAKYLAIFFNEVAAYNIILLSTFLISAVTMYYLVLYLSKDAGASIFAALIYTFCPFHFMRIWQHFGTAQIQWMPLHILLLFKLQQDKDIKTSLLLGLSLALNYYFDVHYGYFMGIATVLFLLMALCRQESRVGKAKFSALFFLGCGLGAVLIIPALLPFLEKLMSGKELVSAHTLVRPFQDLFAQSARPLSYFLPFTEHPLFGNFTRMFIGSHLWGESLTEHNIFLGFIPVSLSILAFIKRKAIVSLMKSKGLDVSFSLRFLFFLVLASWLFSQPPWWDIFGFKIYMPSFIMYKLLPMFRAYVRFGIVVMLGVSILAAFGLLFILGKIKRRGIRMAVLFLVCFLSLFEFWNNPREHVIDVARYPAVYNWLKEQKGDFIIAEYPLNKEGPNELYKFYQTRHNKKMINGTIPATYAHKITQKIRKLSDPKIAGILKWMGVKYILVHRDDYLKTELTEDRQDLDKIPENAGIKLVRSFVGQECPQKDMMCVQKSGPVDVYEVIERNPVKPPPEEKDIQK